MRQKDQELKKLNDLGLEMIALVRKQVSKVGESFAKRDISLAEEVIRIEARVDALELNIDRVCEEILTLQQPLASDFRFVLSVLRMNSELERIGDYAKDIAEYILKWDEDLNLDLFKVLQLPEMFATVDAMIGLIYESLEKEDVNLPRKVFPMDAVLNGIKNEGPNHIAKAIKNEAISINQALNLHTTVRKMERMGDQVKNIAEELIYYLEAKVVKHRKL